MTTSTGDNDQGDDAAGKPKIVKSGHAKLRSSQGRPVGQAINDIQRAGHRDVFVQVDDGRLIIRGPGGREHVIEPEGELVTSLRRSEAAHMQKVATGNRRSATDEEFALLKALVQ